MLAGEGELQGLASTLGPARECTCTPGPSPRIESSLVVNRVSSLTAIAGPRPSLTARLSSITADLAVIDDRQVIRSSSITAFAIRVSADLAHQ
jgi:hypothetical protein